MPHNLLLIHKEAERKVEAVVEAVDVVILAVETLVGGDEEVVVAVTEEVVVVMVPLVGVMTGMTYLNKSETLFETRGSVKASLEEELGTALLMDPFRLQKFDA